MLIAKGSVPGSSPTRLLTLAAVGLLWVACAPALKYEPVSLGPRPLCVADIIPVRTPWDATIHGALRVFLDHFEIAQDVQGYAIKAVAVKALPSRGASVCMDHGKRIATILINVRTPMEPFDQQLQVTILLSSVAHELAHLALRHEQHDGKKRVREAEAEELAVYYLHRVGIDCHEWTPRMAGSPVVHGDLVSTCETAKAGQRLPQRLPAPVSR